MKKARYSNRGTYTPTPKVAGIASHYFDNDTRFAAGCPDCKSHPWDPECFYCQGDGSVIIAHYFRDKTVWVHPHWSVTYHPTYGYASFRYLYGKESPVPSDPPPEVAAIPCNSQLDLFTI